MWGCIIDRHNTYHTVCLPSSFRPIYCGSCIPKAAGAYPVHPPLSLSLEGPSVTRQARETMDRQLQGAAMCRAKEREGVPCCLCAIPQWQGCHCSDEYVTCQNWRNFQAGSHMESVRQTYSNIVGFLLRAEATQSQFIFSALDQFCMHITHRLFGLELLFFLKKNAVEGFG